MRIRIVVCCLATALGIAACAEPEDRAAKARIFSPEDPPRVLQAAAEPIDAAALHEDPARIDRVLSISAREAVARLGPHVQNAKVSFRWSRDDGGKQVKLTENRMVALGERGDFHVRIENDQHQGMEWVKVDGVSYARSRYARFRERRRDRGSSEHVVDSAYETLGTFRDWTHGALKLTPAGTATVAGRRAIRYDVTLGTPHPPRERPLPDAVFPKDGPDPDTALRLAALEKGRPTSVRGSLLVDAETAVPLQAQLEAAVVVPGEQEARLELAVDLRVEGVGQKPRIAVPDHIEDAPRPPGVVAILEAYGIARKGEAEAEAQQQEPTGENPAPEEDE